MLAIVDADYKFMWIDVGANGSGSDSSVFNRTKLKKKFEDGVAGLPAAEPLPGAYKPIPYFLIGDDAFALNTWLMKSYAGRSLSNEEAIFNYRLSSGRQVVENAFGILSHRFRCILKTMEVQPENAKKIVMGCVCLHNLMRIRYSHVQNAALDHMDETQQVIPGTWRSAGELQDMGQTYRNPRTGPAKIQREYLKDYVNSSVGSVAWQDARFRAKPRE